MMLSLIIPCYNEEEVLYLFYREIKDVLRLCDCEHELIFVDDGSEDGTGRILRELAADESVKYITLSRNFGKESAMLAGLRYARGEYIGIMDADLQHPPDLLPQMLAALEEGQDIAAARRCDREGESGIKSRLARFFYKVVGLFLEVEVADGAEDFRIMKRKVADSILAMPEYHRFSKGIFSWVGFKTKWIEHGNRPRPAGGSKWGLLGLAKYAADGIISFSAAPLKIALFLGAAVLTMGFVCAVITVCAGAYSANFISLGYASIISGIMIIGGTILLCVGILGEYMVRIYIEVKRRPVFVIDETNITENSKE